MGDRKPFVLDGGEKTQKFIFDERKLFTGKGAVNFPLVLFAFLFIFFLSGGGGGERIGHATISLLPCLRRELEEEGSLQKWRLFLTYSPFPSVA